MRPELTADYVRERLSYDSTNGEFRWLTTSIFNPSFVGKVAGTVDRHGYRMISLHGSMFFAHRLAWLYVYGEWPIGVIDHINGIPGDNRIENLRDTTQALNVQNQRLPKRGSKTGFIGVSWDGQRRKFYSQISLNGKSHKLGRFDRAEDASAAYWDAKRRLHPGSAT